METESVRLTLPESDLVAVADAPLAKPSVQVELTPSSEGGTRAVFELDLRGYRLAAALDAVEKQVDAAGLQGLSLFRYSTAPARGCSARASTTTSAAIPPSPISILPAPKREATVKLS